MRKALRLIAEPGHRSDQAGWLPSLLLSGLATLFFAVPWALQALALAPSLRALDAATMFIASAMVTTAWALRRHYPGLMLVMAVLGCLLQVILLAPFPTPIVPLIVYDFARWSARYSRAALAAGLVGSFIGPAVWLSSTYFGTEPVYSPVAYLVLVVGCAGLVVASYVVARFLRAASDREQERQENAAERMRHALAEREHRSRTAEANARNQIARELHDIVAHSLSVIVVQAEGGKALAERKPEKAAEVLTTIADTSREALGEMRRIVGVLRDGPDAVGQPDYLPAPTLAEIREMVKRAGPRFHYAEQGTPPLEAPKALQLTAYRVVQEAVTNTLKHGGPQAEAQVTVTYHPSSVELSVIDDGAGVDTYNDRQGHGLQGMHERVHSMGGQLVARPSRDGGFAVHAVLPLHGRHRLPRAAGDTAVAHGRGVPGAGQPGPGPSRPGGPPPLPASGPVRQPARPSAATTPQSPLGPFPGTPGGTRDQLEQR